MTCSSAPTNTSRSSPHRLADWKVGDRVHIWPAHIDPTVASHEQFWIADGDTIIDRWAIDLRHW